MNNLVIDSGNTRIKWGFFEERQLIGSGEVIRSEFLGALRARKELTDTERVIVSNSGASIPELTDLLPRGINIANFKPGFPVPIKINYETPSTLGADRLANAVGAMVRFPSKNCLVIDLGTCITYDVVTKEGVYEGGAIAPGLQMRLKAMHQLTANLPLVQLNPEVDPEGKSTETSLQSGAYHGFKVEVMGMANIYKANYPDLHIIMTGGDRVYFDADTKSSIFADSNLTLTGLNEILLHHEK